MAGASVEAGSGLAAQVQSAVQPKLMENGWVVEENDTTLSEYVTMMVVNGKDLQGVMSELGGDLLGVGEDDAAVGEFARWLFEYARTLAAPQQQAQEQSQGQEGQASQQAAAQPAQDAQMEDSANAGDAPYVNHSPSQHYSHGGRDAFYDAPGYPSLQQQQYYRHLQFQRFQQMQQQQQQLTYDDSFNRPTGPKSMRSGNGNNGPRGGRGGRMLGQMNRNMDRSELPENLRKIRGAAGIQPGRINSHADRAPRGPRGNSNMANGIQRAMNGGGRGAHHHNMNGGGMMTNTQMNPQQQMQLMQMMEMQANILAQAMQANGGQMSFMGNNNRGGFQNGGRGGRGNAQTRGGHRPAPPAPKVLHAENGKMPLGALGSSKPAAAASNPDSMDLDDGANRPQPKFSTMCRFNQACTNPTCDFAHQNPTSTTPVNVDLNETCTFGAACKNFKCTARHPSPAQSNASQQAQGGLQVDCKFWPHCTNTSCPFRHGSAAPCRNGPDCKVEGCTFAHSKIACRFHPCTNSRCTFKHEPGQKAGAKKFEDKVWSKGRFETEDGKEELILPGQQQENGNGDAGGEVKEEKMEDGAGSGQQQAQTEDIVA